MAGRIVAIVANSSWNLWNFRRGLVRALIAAGDEVVLLAPKLDENYDFEAICARFIALKHLRRSGMNPFRDLALLRELSTIYRQEKITHALHFTIKPVVYGSLAARRTGVVNINTLTGLGFTFIRGGWTTKLITILYRYALRDAHRVLFHNEDDQALFLAKRICRPGQAGVVGGSGLRMADFPLQEYPEDWPGHVLFAGRLLRDKGIGEYVAAARIVRQAMPELTFHIVGPLDEENPAGISRSDLKEWIASGAVVYDGVASDIRPHLAAATLVVLPSYREGCPRVLLEAAATGRALVGTDVPGVRSVVRPENGILVPVRDAPALAESILTILAEGKQALQLRGELGQKMVATYFSEAVVNDAYLAALDG